MKIEKLNKENIDAFIRDLSLNEANDLEKNIDKVSYFGIKNDNTFIMGFDALSDEDKIAIIYVRNKIKENEVKDCISFLTKSLSFNNHLIIDVFDKKLISVLDSVYKVKEVGVSLTGYIENNNLKEKLVDIEMKTIRYFAFKKMFYCNLVRQNIQDETTISMIDNYFKKQDFDNISFIIFEKNVEFFNELGYSIVYKSYIVSWFLRMCKYELMNIGV